MVQDVRGARLLRFQMDLMTGGRSAGLGRLVGGAPVHKDAEPSELPAVNRLRLNKLVYCMQIGAYRCLPAAGDKASGQGVGGRSYYGGVPASSRAGTFASSDQAEGPLSQLTISLSCEPPSAAGARLRR